jgi:hypothetical protein
LAKNRFNAETKQVLDDLLLKSPLAQAGKMFGYPAYYVGGKLFACVFEDTVGLKIPKVLEKKLRQRDDITYFQPLGRRKMKE